jgi:predicted metal-dependent phosphoesterase TrpH
MTARPFDAALIYRLLLPMFADLHLHTNFSDGTFTPEELAARAAEQNLAAVALTDHDTIAGCPRMAEACAQHGLEFIPGAEFTADHCGREVHILGYWLDTESPALLAQLATFQAVRTQRIRDMVERLNRRGINLTTDAVFEIAQCLAPGRPHIARALVAGGFCKTFDDAFERYLKKGRAGWVAKTRMETRTTIELIHAVGGVAVLAHPGLYRDDAIIAEIAKHELDGLECWHSKHSADASAGYAQRASELGLVATGGSDCHGMSKGQPLIGRVKLPYEQVTHLKARRRPTPTAETTAAN